MSDDEQSDGEDVCVEPGQDHRTDDEAVFPDLNLGTAWGESITKGRATKLAARLRAWEEAADHDKRRDRFDDQVTGLELLELTGAEVFWLAPRTLVGTSERQVVAAAVERVLQAQVGFHAQIGCVARFDHDLSALNLSDCHESRFYWGW